jgi:glycosyltransferase involved in cell wall biosynthesis/SAM-dependent methyltransferase
MIFLNAEQFISEAIDSVVAQTYGNWELLLVDDGSQDGSGRIARRYVDQFREKVRYLEHDGHRNLGMSASRNLGIQQARGEFIAFLDADDVWLPRKLERQVTALGSQPRAAMIYGPTFEWHGWTGERHDRDRDHLQDLGVAMNTLIEPPRVVAAVLRNEARSPRTCSVLLRREAVSAVNGFEARFRGLYEDQAFFTKLCLRFPVFAIPQCYDKYRQHADGCCNAAVKAGEYKPARLSYLDWLSDYVKRSVVKGDDVWAMVDVKTALEEERWPLRHPWLHWMKGKIRDFRRALRMRVGLIAESLLPVSAHEWVRLKLRGPDSAPRVGRAHFGGLRRLTPISRDFGFDRGQPVDRFYIEQFLAEHKADIRGNVLEVGDDVYTRRFGGDQVTKGDVLHVAEGNPKATIVADLAHAEQVPDNSFDCILLVQTLQFIYESRAALHTVFRILKPGGVLLATVSGISHRGRDEWAASWYWNFTAYSMRKLMDETFPGAEVTIVSHGNVLAATAFLQGLAAKELQMHELRHNDPQYELVITVRAVKPPS